MGDVPAAIAKQIENLAGKFKSELADAEQNKYDKKQTTAIVKAILVELLDYHGQSDIFDLTEPCLSLSSVKVTVTEQVQLVFAIAAVGSSLKYDHALLAATAAQAKAQWLILTNGIEWQVHHAAGKPKETIELFYQFNFLGSKTSNAEQQQLLFLLSKRGMKRKLLQEYYDKSQFVNKYTIAAIIASEKFTNMVKRELCHIQGDLKIDSNTIKNILCEQVICSEITLSEAGKYAVGQVNELLQKKEHEKMCSKNEKMAKSLLSRFYEDELKH